MNLKLKREVSEFSGHDAAGAAGAQCCVRRGLPSGTALGGTAPGAALVLHGERTGHRARGEPKRTDMTFKLNLT